MASCATRRRLALREADSRGVALPRRRMVAVHEGGHVLEVCWEACDVPRVTVRLTPQGVAARQCRPTTTPQPPQRAGSSPRCTDVLIPRPRDDEPIASRIDVCSCDEARGTSTLCDGFPFTVVRGSLIRLDTPPSVRRPILQPPTPAIAGRPFAVAWSSAGVACLRFTLFVQPFTTFGGRVDHVAVQQGLGRLSASNATDAIVRPVSWAERVVGAASAVSGAASVVSGAEPDPADGATPMADTSDAVDGDRLQSLWVVDHAADIVRRGVRTLLPFDSVERSIAPHTQPCREAAVAAAAANAAAAAADGRSRDVARRKWNTTVGVPMTGRLSERARRRVGLRAGRVGLLASLELRRREQHDLHRPPPPPPPPHERGVTEAALSSRRLLPLPLPGGTPAVVPQPPTPLVLPMPLPGERGKLAQIGEATCTDEATIDNPTNDDGRGQTTFRLPDDLLPPGAGHQGTAVLYVEDCWRPHIFDHSHPFIVLPCSPHDLQITSKNSVVASNGRGDGGGRGAGEVHAECTQSPVAAGDTMVVTWSSCRVRERRISLMHLGGVMADIGGGCVNSTGRHEMRIPAEAATVHATFLDAFSIRVEDCSAPEVFDSCELRVVGTAPSPPPEEITGTAATTGGPTSGLGTTGGLPTTGVASGETTGPTTGTGGGPTTTDPATSGPTTPSTGSTTGPATTSSTAGPATTTGTGPASSTTGGFGTSGGTSVVAKELFTNGGQRGFEEGYNNGYRLGMYGYVPSWFTGRDNIAMADFYFDQLRAMPASNSADQVESDLSGGLEPDGSDFSLASV